MKKVTILMAVAILCAVPTFGAMTIQLADGIGTASGGVIIVTVEDDPIVNHGKNSTFETFCLEIPEGYEFGVKYDIQLNDRALYDGGDSSSFDLLDDRTAWIYTEWLNGNIAHTAEKADDVQNAIWYIEDEQPGSNYLVTAADGAIGGGWLNNGRVQVMNMFDQGQVGVYDARKQDLLVASAVAVPAPGALLLGSMGMGLVGWLRRRNTV